MDYQVILSPRAIRDLQSIVRYIAWDSPVDAAKFGKHLIAKARSLATLPERGRVVPEFHDPTIRELIVKPYRIVYRVQHERQQIEVARFWHGAQDRLEVLE